MKTRQATIEERLKSWMAVEHSGQPVWLAKHAPRIIQELEKELAEQNAKVQTIVQTA